MAVSEAKIKIVIDNYFKAKCDVNTSIREAFEKGFRVGVLKGMETQSKSTDDSVPLDVLCEWLSINECSPSCNICERYYKDGLCVRSDVRCGSREHWRDILTDWRNEQNDG